MDKFNGAWQAVRQANNVLLPAYGASIKAMTGKLKNVAQNAGGSTGGGNNGGSGTGDTGPFGPFAVAAGDPILADVQSAYGLITGDLAWKIINGDKPGVVTFRSTAKPSRAPSWAWGDTPNGYHCWINPDKSDVRQEYTILHEYAHTLDYRYLTPTSRTAIRRLLGTSNGWNQGHYSTDYSTVPSEAFADHFARAVTPPRQWANILAGFYRPGLGPVGQFKLLEILKGAMHL